MEGSALRSLRNAMRRGRVVDLPDGGLFWAPAPRLVARSDALYALVMDRVKETVLRGVEVEPSGEDEIESRPGGDYLRVIRERRIESLAEGILLLAEFGRDEEGHKLHETLRTLKPDVAARYDDFIRDVFEHEVAANIDPTGGGTQVSVQALLTAAWARYYFSLALGEDERARGTEALADRVYHGWQRGIAKMVKEGDPLAAQRLSAQRDTAKREGLAMAFRSVKGPLRQRLVERVGQDAVDKALHAPEPRGGSR
jgi:hypothetical protein